jgi:hypothetical protein
MGGRYWVYFFKFMCFELLDPSFIVSTYAVNS